MPYIGNCERPTFFIKTSNINVPSTYTNDFFFVLRRVQERYCCTGVGMERLWVTEALSRWGDTVEITWVLKDFATCGPLVWRWRGLVLNVLSSSPSSLVLQSGLCFKMHYSYVQFSSFQDSNHCPCAAKLEPFCSPERRSVIVNTSATYLGRHWWCHCRLEDRLGCSVCFPESLTTTFYIWKW